MIPPSYIDIRNYQTSLFLKREELLCRLEETTNKLKSLSIELKKVKEDEYINKLREKLERTIDKDIANNEKR